MNWKKQKNKYPIFCSNCYKHINVFTQKKHFYLVLLLFIVSCTPINLYERTAIIPNQTWESNFQPSFNFNIEDTNSLYNIYIIIRHTDAYAYNNIWINVDTKAPNDSVTHQPLNLILANNTKGWLGVGMDDIFEQRIRISQLPINLKKGLYSFTLTQIMRINSLPHILNVGIRLEKFKA